MKTPKPALIPIFFLLFIFSTGLIAQVIWPPDFDNKQLEVLHCENKKNAMFNLNPYLLNSPECLGGFLLDSGFWLSHPNEPDIYPNRRLPRSLGWNVIDTGTYSGHPNPESEFYPQHKNWSMADPVCWSANMHVLWMGTGIPVDSNCQQLEISFEDMKMDFGNPMCFGGSLCYKILRSWTVKNLCNNDIFTHVQSITVEDSVPPQIIYPDTISIKVNEFCEGRWNVTPPWMVDNCSNTLDYFVGLSGFAVKGDQINGYYIDKLERGFYTAAIIAEDCCGNNTTKEVVLYVYGESMPLAVCGSKTVTSIPGDRPPGQNFKNLPAKNLDQGSISPCNMDLYYKAIRIVDLSGSKNGVQSDQSDLGKFCKNISGDDDSLIIGNQIYFDDELFFCCEDVGRNIQVLLRVFDLDPGTGPVFPGRMDPGGDLFNHFSDCVTIIEIQDRNVPTLVPPPNIVISCQFEFTLDELKDANNPKFGRILNGLGQRSKVSTIDIVCENFCIRNDITTYPGHIPNPPPSNPPAPNRACEYYQSLINPNKIDQTYELVWGFDGYVLSSCINPVEITIEDHRVCGQGRIDRRLLTRGPNGITVTAVQTIWIVECGNMDPIIGVSKPPVERKGAIQLSLELSTLCQETNSITSSYEIDEFNDAQGKYPEGYDFKVGPLSEAEFVSGKIPTFNDNPYAANPNNPFDATGSYPVGVHKIRWTTIDPCGIINSIIKIFEIKKTVSNKQTFEDDNIEFYPNPSTGVVFVTWKKAIHSIKLFSASGQLINQQLLHGLQSVSLEKLHSGLYFIQLYNTEGRMSTLKFLVIN